MPDTASEPPISLRLPRLTRWKPSLPLHELAAARADRHLPKITCQYSHSQRSPITVCAYSSICPPQVKPETALVRPFVVAAVLRGVTFDPTRYNSFIDLQVPAPVDLTSPSQPLQGTMSAEIPSMQPLVAC